MAWEDNKNLSKLLEDLNKRNAPQVEMLEIVKKSFPQYCWSLRTLQRRLKAFGIQKISYEITPKELLDAVQKELNQGGEDLGIRAMHLTVRTEHNALVSRNDVYLAMNTLCPQKLQERNRIKERKLFHKRQFTSPGANYMWSIDGHDKLMGKNKSQFPLGIHGAVDTFSRKIIWLKVWPNNSQPIFPAKWFLNAIIEMEYLPKFIRSDRGGENVLIATIQNVLHTSEEGKPNHLFGSSTTNQVIESWWKQFSERKGKYIKSEILKLVTTNYYDEHNSTCRVLLAYVLHPIIQAELNKFKRYWNGHRIRLQNISRPCGVPDYLYEFPEKNNGIQHGEIPHIDKFQLAVNQVDGLGMKFIDDEIDDLFITFLRSKQLQPTTFGDGLQCYKALFDEFKNQTFTFSYDNCK